MHKICLTISLFHPSTCFEHHVLIVRRSKLHYTASGIITPVLIVRSKLYYTASGIITPVLIVRSKLYYTASGIITPIGVMMVLETCRGMK